jgi:hypothetical protein
MPIVKEHSEEETLLDKEVELLSIVEFLGQMQEKSTTFTHQLDIQASILIGITSAIFIFSLSQFFSGTKEFSLIILGGFAAVSTLLALLAIHPPRFMRKEGQEESLLFNKKVSSFPSAGEYEKELVRILDKPDQIIKQYAIELYNLARYYYRPKRKLFNLARNILLAGVVLTMYSFMIEILLHYLVGR